MRTSSFHIYLISPVVRKMLCGNFSESREKKVMFEDIDGTSFKKALDVWYGRKDCQEVALGVGSCGGLESLDEGAAGGTRGHGVVGKIRFPLMEEQYLRNRVAESVCEEHQEWMARVVLEALRAKAARREGAVLECAICGWQDMKTMLRD